MPRLWVYTAQECLHSVLGGIGRFAAQLATQIAGQLVTIQPICQNSQGTNTRQTQVQDSGISLQDILHAIPTLPDLLTPDAQKALSATCKIFRLRFIAQIQVVTVVRKENYALVCGRRWPRLSMVILQGETACDAVSQLSDSIRIINLHVVAEGNNEATISMLRPLRNHATDLPCTRSAAQQLAHQMRVRWPFMYSFKMIHMHDLDGLSQQIVSQLGKGTWTHLQYLSLTDCDLDAEAFSLLSQGNWPYLRSLDISGTCVDAEGMALLAKGNWPLLSAIKLSFSSTLDAIAIAHLSAANWLVEELKISDTMVSIDTAAELADLQLPNIILLDLLECSLTAAAVSELARADWPILSFLFIGTTNDAVAVLLGLDLEKVQELKSDPCLAQTVSLQRIFKWPDMGLWPNLRHISIHRDWIYLSI